jgi:MFS family permease
MKYLALLRRNPGFARLWYAQAISFIGDWFNYIAVANLLTHYAGVSGIAISGLLLARFLPPLIASPIAGVLVDRRNRRRLMIFSDLTRALIVIGFLFINASNWFWLPYLLVVLHASLGAVFEPARSAFMPSVIEGNDLVTANLLSSVTWSVMLAIGGATGGLVAGAFGTNVAFVIDALSFVLSAFFIFSIRSVNAAPVRAVPTEKPLHQEGSFREGLQYIRTHPATAATMLVKLGGNIGSFDTLLVLYATSLFVVGKDGAISTGLLYTAFGVGAILGPLIVDRFNDQSVRKMRRLVSVGYALIAVGLFLMAGAPILIAALGAVCIKAMGSSVYWTYSSVILQKTVEDRFLGRIFAFDQAGFQLATVISTVITGALTEGATNDHLRAVVLGTAIMSFIPFIAWTLALPWIEQHAKREKAAAALQQGHN